MSNSYSIIHEQFVNKLDMMNPLIQYSFDTLHKNSMVSVILTLIIVQHGRQRRLTEKTPEEIQLEQVKAAKLKKAGLTVLEKVYVYTLQL